MLNFRKENLFGYISEDDEINYLNEDLAEEDSEELDNDELNNFKGIYFNENSEEKYYEGGAHFQYRDLFKRLEKVIKNLSPSRTSENNNDTNYNYDNYNYNYDSNKVLNNNLDKAPHNNLLDKADSSKNNFKKIISESKIKQTKDKSVKKENKKCEILNLITTKENMFMPKNVLMKDFKTFRETTTKTLKNIQIRLGLGLNKATHTNNNSNNNNSNNNNFNLVTGGNTSTKNAGKKESTLFFNMCMQNNATSVTTTTGNLNSNMPNTNSKEKLINPSKNGNNNNNNTNTSNNTSSNNNNFSLYKKIKPNLQQSAICKTETKNETTEKPIVRDKLKTFNINDKKVNNNTIISSLGENNKNLLILNNSYKNGVNLNIHQQKTTSKNPLVSKTTSILNELNRISSVYKIRNLSKNKQTNESGLKNTSLKNVIIKDINSRNTRNQFNKQYFSETKSNSFFNELTSTHRENKIPNLDSLYTGKKDYMTLNHMNMNMNDNFSNNFMSTQNNYNNTCNNNNNYNKTNSIPQQLNSFNVNFKTNYNNKSRNANRNLIDKSETSKNHTTSYNKTLYLNTHDSVNSKYFSSTVKNEQNLNMNNFVAAAKVGNGNNMGSNTGNNMGNNMGNNVTNVTNVNMNMNMNLNINNIEVNISPQIKKVANKNVIEKLVPSKNKIISTNSAISTIPTVSGTGSEKLDKSKENKFLFNRKFKNNI